MVIAVCAAVAVLVAGVLVAGPAAALPPTHPSAPVSPAVVAAGGGSFTLGWLVPTSDGGSPITGYTVNATSAVAGAPSGTCHTFGALTCSVSGLYNAVSYSFTVVASNALGDSPPASAGPATALGVSPPPRSVVAVPHSEFVDVSWSAPVSDGGGAISAYHVSTSPGPASCDAILPTLGCRVSGLTNGQSYSFIVTATNPYGVSDPSDPGTATPRTVPGAPTAVTATPDNTQAIIEWSPPVFDGGSPITAYTVSTVPTSAGCSTAGALTCTAAGLANGTVYTFSVTATNVAGTGPAATAGTTPRTVPAAPTGVSAAPDNTTAQIAWVAPDDGGSLITGYTVTSVPPSGGCITAGAPTCQVVGLANGTPYTFSVTATNVAGTGAAGTATTTPRTVPGAPTGTTATPGNAEVLVTWSAPADNGGAAITGYTVVGSPSGGCTTSGALNCT
ncbi:MAG: fibronectin type III domain-containing protein, partial [Actinomycetes bacterium]